jgi:hypothetical protein
VWLEYNSRFTLHEDEQNRSGGIGSFYGPPLEVTILASGFLEFGERFYSPRLWTSILATRHGELEILLSKVCFRIHALLNFTRKLHPCTRAPVQQTASQQTASRTLLHRTLLVQLKTWITMTL